MDTCSIFFYAVILFVQYNINMVGLLRFLTKQFGMCLVYKLDSNHISKKNNIFNQYLITFIYTNKRIDRICVKRNLIYG